MKSTVDASRLRDAREGFSGEPSPFFSKSFINRLFQLIWISSSERYQPIVVFVSGDLNHRDHQISLLMGVSHGCGDEPLAERDETFKEWGNGLEKPKGEWMVVGSLPPTVIDKLANRGLYPATATITVRDDDVVHTHRDSKDDALPWEWYLDLPTHMASPRAVLLDKSDPKGALLLVFDIDGQTGKIVDISDPT